MAQDFESPSPPMLDQPRKRNTALIVIIVVVILLLCCCLALVAFAATWLWNNGDRILQNWNQGFVLLRSLL